MSDILTARKFVYTVLSGDGTLTGLVSKIADDLAPDGTATPYIVVSKQSPQQAVTTVNNQVIYFDETILVKAIDDQPGYGRLGPIINRVRALLQRASGTTVGGVVIGCTETGPGVEFAEIDSGRTFRHLGILFRVLTQ